MTYVTRSAVLAFAVCVSLMCFAVAAPDIAAVHYSEDHVVEWTTAGLFALAGLVAFFRQSRQSRFDPVFAVVGFVGFVAALDELSFGERLFGWQPPVLFGTKIDGVHDFLQMTRSALAQNLANPVPLALAMLAFAALVTWLVVRKYRAGGLLDGLVRRCPEWRLFAAATACVAVALTLDLHLGALQHPLVEALQIEESLEFTAGLLMLLFCIGYPLNAPVAAADRPIDHRREVDG